MGYFMFYVVAIAACLLWSATFTAAAARTERPWIRRLLVAVAAIVPVLSLLPFVVFTGLMAFGSRPIQANWFGPTLTAALSALIGGIWIAVVGFSRPACTSHRVAAQWPLIGLAAMFVAAKAVTFGILLLIENAVAAQATYLRLEAASIMQSNRPPAVADADIAGYRSLMKSFQKAASGFGPYSEIKKSVDDIGARMEQRSPGIFTASLFPPVRSVFRAWAQSEAIHRSAAVLVAAVKHRLEGDSLPATLENLAPKQFPVVPRDPFADDEPLLVKKTDAFWTVYSVGPDGEDDGGPPAPGTEKTEGNDDVGLRLAL